MELKQLLETFKTVRGFLLVALFSGEGRLLHTISTTERRTVAEMESVREIIGNAPRIAAELALGKSSELDIRTRSGLNVLIRTNVRERAGHSLLLLCSAEARLGLIRHRLQQILPDFWEALS